MTFQELVERTTPGPLEVSRKLTCPCVNDGHKTIAEITNSEVSNCMAIGEGEANALRLAHSYNVLPEVVAALEGLNRAYNESRMPTLEERTACRQALAKANQITE